jgi:hypothetical protein
VRYDLNPYILFRTLHSAHTVYLCVPYGSHNKQLLFSHTALTSWALLRRRNVFPVRYDLNSYILFRTLHSAHTMHLCVPYGSHNKQRLFPQTALTGWALLRRRNVFPVRYELDFRRNSVFEGLSFARYDTNYSEGPTLV